MNYRPLLVIVCLLCFSSFLAAQPAESTKTAPAKNVAANNKAEKDPEAERILRERRANAQSMLMTLASDAGRFNDQTLRARTQARIADVLWAADPDRARALFRKAWESAEIVDQEGQRKLQEDIARQAASNGGNISVSGPPNIRGEVLRLAARRDRALGEELLARLKVEKEREATEAADRTKSDPLNAPEAATQRLNLARQLLSTDVERAIQFADPVLTSITRDAIDFLSYLREKDAAAADRRYAVLLGRAAGELQSDANTVSILSSYIFTPHIFVTFTGSGHSTSQSSNNSTPPDVPAELRTAFLRAAGDILLRPLAPPGQDQTTAGIQGKYLMLKRLGPLFDQYAPRELAEAIRAQAEALAQAVPEDARRRDDDDTVREGIRPPQSSADREKALLDRLDRAKTADERDALYIQLARLYVENGDLKARDFVAKIEETELRNKARAFIDATLVLGAVSKKDADMILELVKTGELTHPQKSWGLIQAAKFLTKTDRDKAVLVIVDGLDEARRIEELDPDRPRAILNVANALLAIDRAKAWDMVYEAIKAANSAEGFTGEDGLIRLAFQTKQMSTIRSSTVAEFNVAGIFAELANEDYDRAVELARGFQREAPRASATIAIARSIFEEKKK
ncbi:MAG TPA: hypothetical protein VHQ95_22770 [Pyrinomonadaceae bacterium]|nr:hypothetical protein [Pyrinomonadaceae bacterium]